MAKRNVDEFTMALGKSESHLTKAGKEQLFGTFKEYVEAKIEWHTGASRGFTQTDLKKARERCEEVEKLLKEMLDAIIIRVELE